MTDEHDDPRERRQHPRANVVTTAIVLVRHNDGVEAQIVSLSVGGALLIGALSVAAGERVQVLFEIDRRPLDVAAEVVRAEPLDMASSRVAVQFIDLADEVVVLIRRLIAGIVQLEAEQLAEPEDG